MASTDKDLPLKVKVAAAFRRMGYIAFSEVDLCTYTYRGAYKRKQITDFDVLGIRIDPDLEAFIAVAECKSVRDRAMEHLLKLHGVQEFFKAQKAYFVQQKIDVNAREVGAQMGVTCLDVSNLERVLKSLSIEEEEVALERQVYDIRSSMLGHQKQHFVRQVEYLKYDFWTLPDHRNIINITRLLEQMAPNVDPCQCPQIALCHQLVTALAIAILRMSGSIVRSNIDDHQEAVLTAILGGSRERRDREVLHDTVARVVPDATFSLIPEFLAPLAELSGRYINAMSFSHRVVACLDEMGRRAALGEKAKGLPPISELFHDRTIKLARDAFFFTTEVSRIPKEMYGMSLSD